MKVEYAYWMAAAIDGEGSILIRDRGRSKARTPRWQVHLVLANQDLRFLEFAAAICGCGKIYDGKRAKQLRIETAADACRVLREIEPYLLIKRDRANEALRTMLEQVPYVAMRENGRFSSRGGAAR